MKMPLLIFVLISASATTMYAEIIPYDTKTPLFELYEMELLSHQGPDPHTHQMKAGKLLLSVHTLRGLRLLPDGSGVQAALNGKDTQTFAQHTHTHTITSFFFAAMSSPASSCTSLRPLMMESLHSPTPTIRRKLAAIYCVVALNRLTNR